MKTIRTKRLELFPATLALLDAELDSSRRLGELLDAKVPGSWPPGEYDRSAMEFFRARLAESPDAAGWYGWYAVHRPAEGDVPSLVASGGYMGPPDASGVVEVGYSVVPEARAVGFATELVEALVTRAFSTPGVVRVIARTTPANVGSIKVLERCGFRLTGPAEDPGTVRYEAPRPAA